MPNSAAPLLNKLAQYPPKIYHKDTQTAGLALARSPLVELRALGGLVVQSAKLETTVIRLNGLAVPTLPCRTLAQSAGGIPLKINMPETEVGLIPF